MHVVYLQLLGDTSYDGSNTYNFSLGNWMFINISDIAPTNYELVEIKTFPADFSESDINAELVENKTFPTDFFESDINAEQKHQNMIKFNYLI